MDSYYLWLYQRNCRIGVVKVKRDTLIWKIVQTLNDNGALDVNNYMNYIEQANDIHNIIEKELDGYVIVKGEVME